MSAKVEKNTFRVGPWTMKPKEFESFVKVTESNRPNAMVYGRIFYIIDVLGKNYTFRGTMIADPRFTKGHILYPYRPWDIIPKDVPNKTHYRVYIYEETDYHTWVTQNKALFDKHISEGTLFIKPTDPILTYHTE